MVLAQMEQQALGSQWSQAPLRTHTGQSQPPPPQLAPKDDQLFIHSVILRLLRLGLPPSLPLHI